MFHWPRHRPHRAAGLSKTSTASLCCGEIHIRQSDQRLPPCEVMTAKPVTFPSRNLFQSYPPGRRVDAFFSARQPVVRPARRPALAIWQGIAPNGRTPPGEPSTVLPSMGLGANPAHTKPSSPEYHKAGRRPRTDSPIQDRPPDAQEGDNSAAVPIARCQAGVPPAKRAFRSAAGSTNRPANRLDHTSSVGMWDHLWNSHHRTGNAPQPGASTNPMVTTGALMRTKPSPGPATGSGIRPPSKLRPAKRHRPTAFHHTPSKERARPAKANPRVLDPAEILTR